MTKETHTAGGILISLATIKPLVERTIDFNEINGLYFILLIILYIYFAAAGSYFPDIDLKSSYASKRYPFIWKYYGKRQKHRGFTHSLAVVIILLLFSLALTNITNNNIVVLYITLGFTCGWASHIALDLLNHQGVRLLYPLPFNIKLMTINTGNWGEKIIYVLLKTGSAVCTFYVAFSFMSCLTK